MSRVKLLSILFSLLLFVMFGLNTYAQDAPSFKLAPQITEQSINKVPYSPGILPDIIASTAYSQDAVALQWQRITVPGGVQTNVAALSGLYYGGAFVGSVFYACTYNPNNLYTINLTTGVPTLVGSLTNTTGYVPTSMAYYQPSGPMYIGAPSASLTSTNLYTCNVSTGACTLIGTVTNSTGLIFMSIDCNGDIYGVDIVSDNTLKINRTTGVGTILGNCGINANYAQGGAFELSTGTLYWASYSSSASLRTINLTTGASTQVATLTGEPVAFGIQGTCGPAPACDMSTGPFVSLPTSFFTGISYPIKAKVTNVGTATQTSIPVKFFVNGTQYGTTQTIASLAPGAFDTNTVFNWTPTANGSTVLKIATALACDTGTLRANDTVTTTVMVGLGTIFCDDFEAGSGNWTITNNGGVCIWATRPLSSRPYTMPATAAGNVMSADVDLCGSGTFINSTATLTNSLNCSGYSSVYCEFDNDFYLLGSDQCKLDVSTDGGTTWINKFTWTTAHRNSHETQTLPEANGQANVKIRLISIQPSWDWWWAVDNVCVKGTGSGVNNNNSNIPTEYTLKQNYPNPFNPTTVISYALPKSGIVKLVVYDLLGREVKTLVNEFKAAGTYEITFDASGIASGLYFYRFEAGGFIDIKKIVLIK
jgi:hypothetical protein